MTDFFISINPRHVQSILSGTKRVEIRRTRSKLQEGDTLWIYSTRPDAAVVAHANVVGSELNTRQQIWSKYRQHAALTRDEYDAYTVNAAEIFAIELDSIEVLQHPVSLEELRSVRSFHPPQYTCRLNPNDTILQLLKQAKER